MDAGNMFAIVTAVAFLSVLPIALYLEGPMLQGTWDKALKVHRRTARARATPPLMTHALVSLVAVGSTDGTTRAVAECRNRNRN